MYCVMMICVFIKWSRTRFSHYPRTRYIHSDSNKLQEQQTINMQVKTGTSELASEKHILSSSRCGFPFQKATGKPCRTRTIYLWRQSCSTNSITKCLNASVGRPSWRAKARRMCAWCDGLGLWTSPLKERERKRCINFNKIKSQDSKEFHWRLRFVRWFGMKCTRISFGHVSWWEKRLSGQVFAYMQYIILSGWFALVLAPPFEIPGHPFDDIKHNQERLLLFQIQRISIFINPNWFVSFSAGDWSACSTTWYCQRLQRWKRKEILHILPMGVFCAVFSGKELHFFCFNPTLYNKRQHMQNLGGPLVGSCEATGQFNQCLLKTTVECSLSHIISGSETVIQLIPLRRCFIMVIECWFVVQPGGRHSTKTELVYSFQFVMWLAACLTHILIYC